ncbi:unnamed protein product [Calypogeia fissa]
MGLLLIMGSVLFSAIFVLAAWQKINDFGHDGGAAAKTLSPRYGLFHYHIYNFLGLFVRFLSTGEMKLYSATISQAKGAAG